MQNRARRKWLIVPMVGALMAVLSPPSYADERTSEQCFADSINSERASAGLNGLAVSPELTSVARRHSADMAQQGAISHNAALPTQISGWTNIAENVGVGPDCQVVHSALMNSSTHREKVLGDGFNFMGVGVVAAGTELFVTQVFMRGSGSPAPPAETQAVVGNDAPAPQYPPARAPHPARVSTEANAAAAEPDQETTPPVAAEPSPPSTASAPSPELRAKLSEVRSEKPVPVMELASGIPKRPSTRSPGVWLWGELSELNEVVGLRP